MSLEEKIGQMIMPWARIQFMNVKSPEYLLLREEMQKYHVGGFGVTVFTDGPALLKSEPLEAAALTNGLQADSKYPLLFGADFERGLSMRMIGSTAFPPAMAFGATGDIELVRQFGSITAQEARAVGIQWNWFPVADVNSNPANPIINTRSFGEDPSLVGEMVSAYIAGARSGGLLTTVKHFPGHGDTDTDSHLTLARSNASRERLDRLELIPFRDAIAAGVDSVMVAHITVPAIEPDPNRPASISSNVITKLLQQELGFHGLVVTDALDMGALTRVFPGTPAQVSAAEAVEAIKAGNDMVIIPADLDGAYNGLLDAVKQGVISQQRIDISVLKILRLKASVGLDRNRLVDINAVGKEIAQPDNLAIAQEVADRAITLVSDTNHLLPLSLPTASMADQPIVAIVFTDDAHSSDGGHAFAKQLRQRIPNASIFYIDSANSAYTAPAVLSAVHSAATVIAVAESFPSARRTTQGPAGGSSGLDDSSADLLAIILKSSASKTIVAAFGSPYVSTAINASSPANASSTKIGTYVCTFSNTPTSAVSLARALFAEIPVHGRLPVTIPGIGVRGTGLDRAAVPVTGPEGTPR
jgi:beta-N-acetylhexosaminidase